MVHVGLPKNDLQFELRNLRALEGCIGRQVVRGQNEFEYIPFQSLAEIIDATLLADFGDRHT